MIEELELLANRMSAGSVSIGDWETLIHYANGKDTVVELGTNTGSTAAVLSLFCRRVITIDIFEDLDLIDNLRQRQMYKNHWAVNRHTLKGISEKLSIYGNILVCQSLSYDAAEASSDSSVDLLFIDADHSRPGVKRDYEAWLSKVKTGGYFAFHDVGPGCEVFDFYNEELVFDQRIELQECVAVGPCWTKVFMKK